MRTVFISANDTGSGKTYVTAALATHLLLRGQSVQVVKPVQTGIDEATPLAATDAGFVSEFARQHAPAYADALHAVTLQHFTRPLAPVDAALHERRALCFDALVAALQALPKDAHWRLVEGAGGLAVPLESNGESKFCDPLAATPLPAHTAHQHNPTPLPHHQYNPAPLPHQQHSPAHAAHEQSLSAHATHQQHNPAADSHGKRVNERWGGVHAQPRDWADFALAIQAEVTLLVVADRLGAINQARLLGAYAQARGLPQPGLWLNQTQPGTPADVRTSNANALRGGTVAVPLWAMHNHGELWPHTLNAPWLK